MAMKRRILKIIGVTIFAIFLIASTLFIYQGGFGGGHSRCDFIIMWLSLPWLLLPWPEAVWAKSDFFPVVLFPFFINSTFFLIVLLAIRWKAKLKKNI
jgi:hypothetical protein